MSVLKPIFCFAVAFIATATFVTDATVCQASILSPYSGLIRAEDNDAESLLPLTDTKLQVGDFLLAVAEFPEITPIPGLTVNYGTSTPMLTSVSLLKLTVAPVLSTTPAGPNVGDYAEYTFSAPTKAEWLAQTGLVVDGNNTLLAVYDDPAATPHIDATGTVATGISTASNGTLLYEFGTVGSGTFWKAVTKVGLAFDPTDIADLVNPAADGTLQFIAALNLVKNYSGPPVLPFNYMATSSGETPGLFSNSEWTSAVDLQLYGSSGAGLPLGASFGLPTDTTAYLKLAPVPEASSIAVWLLLSTITAIAGRRQNSRRS